MKEPKEKNQIENQKFFFSSKHIPNINTRREKWPKQVFLIPKLTTIIYTNLWVLILTNFLAEHHFSSRSGWFFFHCEKKFYF
jgi:hypothetical protein